MIYYNKHHLTKEDILAVNNTLKYGKLSKGNKLDEFEKRLKYFLFVVFLSLVSGLFFFFLMVFPW